MIDFAHIEKYKENNRIEAKTALGGFPTSLWETYSSFANTLGGIILLGVEERKDKSFHVVNLPEPEKLVREFWALVNDPIKVSVNILSDEDVTIKELGGKRYISIIVPEADCADRPVYIDGDPIHGTYRRNGEGDYRCTAEEIYAMIRDAARAGTTGAAASCTGKDLEARVHVYKRVVIQYLTDNIAARISDLSALLGVDEARMNIIIELLLGEGTIILEDKGGNKYYKLKA